MPGPPVQQVATWENTPEAQWTPEMRAAYMEAVSGRIEDDWRSTVASEWTPAQYQTHQQWLASEGQAGSAIPVGHTYGGAGSQYDAYGNYIGPPAPDMTGENSPLYVGDTRGGSAGAVWDAFTRHWVEPTTSFARDEIINPIAGYFGMDTLPADGGGPDGTGGGGAAGGDSGGLGGDSGAGIYDPGWANNLYAGGLNIGGGLMGHADAYAETANSLYDRRQPVYADQRNADEARQYALTGIRNQQSNLGHQATNLQYLDRVQRGLEGPSQAELMADRQREAASRNLLAVSQSGPQFNAAAQAAAARGGEQMYRERINETAMLRAQEQAQARGQYGAALGQYGQSATSMGAAALGLQGQDAGQSQFNVNSYYQNQGQNDAAYQNLLQGQQAMFGMGLDAYGAQQGARAGYDEMMADQWSSRNAVLADLHKTDTGAEGDNLDRGLAIFGSLFGSMSDERSKENLRSAEAEIERLNARLGDSGGSRYSAENNSPGMAEMAGQAMVAASGRAPLISQDESGAWEVTTGRNGRREMRELTPAETDALVGDAAAEQGRVRGENVSRYAAAAGPSAEENYATGDDASVATDLGRAFYESTVGQATGHRGDGVLPTSGQQLRDSLTRAWHGEQGPEDWGDEDWMLYDSEADPLLNDRAASRALARTEPRSFQYTPEAQARYPGMTQPGQQYGVVAQDLAQSPVGRQAVRRGPDGMLSIDTGQLAIIDAMSIGDLSRRLDELEGGGRTDFSGGGRYSR